MKTAMQIAIESYKNDGVSFTDWFIDNYEILLEREKEQIMKAIQDAYKSTYNSCESGCGGNIEIDFTPEQYYNSIYNQNK